MRHMRQEVEGAVWRDVTEAELPIYTRSGIFDYNRGYELIVKIDNKKRIVQHPQQ